MQRGHCLLTNPQIIITSILHFLLQTLAAEFLHFHSSSSFFLFFFVSSLQGICSSRVLKTYTNRILHSSNHPTEFLFFLFIKKKKNFAIKLLKIQQPVSSSLGLYHPKFFFLHLPRYLNLQLVTVCCEEEEKSPTLLA